MRPLVDCRTSSYEKEKRRRSRSNPSVDVVISNGVLNLVPEKRQAVAEIHRILKPAGRVQIADIVVGVELPEAARQEIDLWTG